MLQKLIGSHVTQQLGLIGLRHAASIGEGFVKTGRMPSGFFHEGIKIDENHDTAVPVMPSSSTVPAQGPSLRGQPDLPQDLDGRELYKVGYVKIYREL
jgi:hypothetical protein